MAPVELQSYILPAALVGFFAWKSVKYRRVRGRIPGLLEQGAVVIDVRSSGEYAGGAAEGSINMPLDRLTQELGHLDPAKPVILCCASGARSSVAASMLRKKGFKNVVNAGPWTNVRRH